MSRVVIQRNRIHHPRYGANSWSDGDPFGPQPVFFSQCGGNHVIRYNEIYSGDVAHYFKDGIGGGDNFASGFPNADSDIYGNSVQHTWDDAIEAEGADRNVRIWGNYLDSTTAGVATTAVGAGPIYIFRNVYNRSRQLFDATLDGDDRNVFAKAGSTAQAGGGIRGTSGGSEPDDDFRGAAPDMGAHEGGSPRMRFGVAAGQASRTP